MHPLGYLLQASGTTADELEQGPARIALADAIKFSQWIEDRYEALELRLSGRSWRTVLESISTMLS